MAPVGVCPRQALAIDPPPTHAAGIAWPFVFFAVTALDKREYVLRLDCRGYPQQAPTDRTNSISGFMSLM
jgi:hypothetical protein